MKVSRRAPLSMFFILALAAQSFADDVSEFVYPTLPESAVAPEGFVPEGWAIEVESKGDLNKDKRDDLLLVLKGTYPEFMMTNEPATPGMDEWDANPRILAVAFALKKGGYRLVFQNNSILPRHEDPCIDDPFGGADISDGTLKIGYHFWANAGSWYTTSSWCTFLYKNGVFRLIAFTNFTTKRNTGETWDIALDYVSRRATITLSNFASDEDEEAGTYERELPRGPLMTIDQIPSIDVFYPEQMDVSWWEIEEGRPEAEEE